MQKVMRDCDEQADEDTGIQQIPAWRDYILGVIQDYLQTRLQHRQPSSRCDVLKYQGNGVG